MSFSIRWTTKAQESFGHIIRYLEEYRSEKQVRKFISVVNITLKRTADFPYMFEASTSNPSIRKGFVTKQCSFFYQIDRDAIALLYFWDNRRKPRF
jgi:plasmid stabilization system protein ParE